MFSGSMIKIKISICPPSAAPTIIIDAQVMEGLTVRAGDTIVITATSILGKPAPTSCWSKGGKYFKPSDLVQIETTATSSTLSVKYASRKDSGDYIITASNPFGVKEETVKVKVLDVPGAPGPIECSGVSSEKVTLTWTAPTEDGGSPIKYYTLEKRETRVGEPAETKEFTEIVEHAAEPGMELDVELRRTLVVRAGCSIRLFVPVKGRPTPTVTWTKEGGPVPRAVIDSTESFTMLIIPESSRIDAGKYELTLENSAGKKSADIHVRVLDSPGPPLNLKPIKIDKESITLQWEMPLIDGGAKITNYIIEKRESTRKAFATVVTKCPTTSVRICDLGEGCEYYFRVSAENEYGIGEAVETSDPIRASQTPSSPESIIPTDITKNSISLAWTKPKHDGGSRITGYVLEAQKKGTDQWSHITTVKNMDFTVKNLNENEEYIFHVMAVNHSGRSIPKESKPIVVKDSTSLPEFDLRGVCHKTVIAKAGDDIKVEIPVMGRPRPTVSWQKDGAALKLTQRTNVETTAATVIISISECTRADSGVYTMTGKNIVGSVTDSITLKVHDVPGPPKGPVKIVEISRTYCIFSWDAPENDGGVPINNYVIEIRDTTSQTWTELSSTVIRTMFKAIRLTTGSEYQFRIKAKNRYGVGPPITSETVVAAYPFKVPGPPGTPNVVAFTKNSITIGWNEPVNDGGNEVIGYHVERKERTSIMAIIDSTTSYTSLIIENVNRFDSGKYNLTVENSSGSKTVTVQVRVLDTPSAPQNLKITAVTKDAVTLTWDPPVNDGGVKIKNYVVEKRESTRKAYATVNALCYQTTFTVDQLLEGCNYYFRVLAENEYGIGLPIETGESVKVSEKPQPPGKITLKDVTKNSVTLSWEKPEHDGGSRVGCYVVEILPKGADKWTQALIVKETEATISGLNAGEEYILFIPIKGRPTPTIKWDKDEAPLKESAQVEITSSYTLLVIDKMSRNDSGKYTVSAENSSGTKSALVVVRVLDTPSAPV
uniref:Titin n=1 Tax=Maylandia zebra TaxID=106582 RepID=A0A3P9BE99_9CICH